MSVRDSLRRIVHLPLATLIALNVATPVVAASPAVEDALARVEFDGEMTIDVKDSAIAVVFRLISRMTRVPFVLDFDADPSLRVTFRSQNMVCRGILASLASAHDLEYSATAEGILVRRRGAPPAAKRTVVGAWPALSGPGYELKFLVRSADGAILYQPRISLQKSVAGQLKLGLNGREVLVFDKTRNIAEPRYIGGLELTICIQRDSEAGLELLLEVVTARPVHGNSYSQDHTVVRRTATSGETSLFKTADGHEVLLTDWNRLPVTGRNN